MLPFRSASSRWLKCYRFHTEIRITLFSNDGEIISNALVTLDENASESVGTPFSFTDRIALLTDQQKQAVGNFVLVAVKHPDIADDPKSFKLIKDLITRWTPYAWN